ncbi:MAG: hypothetical protein IKW61_07620, partial [Bacteroidaceae bacterium]|nr:hypothetical protein [Bacteroidaceae bacterium]
MFLFSSLFGVGKQAFHQQYSNLKQLLNMLTSKEIRESFKEFFKSKEHLIVPSAPMVVKDDPTLMFTNAG